jgi:glycosyltransferase involved in cell wall biosynthesis
MRLLYTLTTYPPSIGGAQIHQHQLARQFQRQPQHQVQVVSHWDQNRTDWLLGTTLLAPAHSKDYEIDGIPVHRMGTSWQEKLKILPYLPLYYPMMQVALPPIANRLERCLQPFADQADVIHNVRIGREGLSVASWQAARRRDIPFILTPVHHPRWVGWRYRAYCKLYTLADAVIALTEAERQVLIGLGVAPERVSVTGIGPILADQANPDQFLKTYNLQAPMVLFLGQHYLYKGYRQVLEAAPLVWQKIPEAQFVFIGPGVKQSDQDFAALSDPRIHRLGKVDLQTKTDALAACNLLCVPSNQESFGGVYTEGWSLSKPVIGCNIPAVADVISDGVDGFLVNQEAGAIADRICHLLSDPVAAETMGEAGLQKVKSRYSWEYLAKITEAIYRSAG